MAQEIDLSEIIQQAKDRGYFDFADFPGLTLSLDQFKELSNLLRKKKIPFGTVSSATKLTQQEALLIVNSLRKGVPPPVDVTHFSVGRKNLTDKFSKDLQAVEQGSSRVRFMNADYGYGKTHSLYLLREIAFRQGFVVSIVTLSQNSCPIHDFMTVYNRIMWNLRTRDERNRSAIENVLDRWLKTIREKGEERAKQIIKPLPDDLKSALHAYHESISPIRPNEDKRLLVLNYLSGKKVYLRDLHSIGIIDCIDSSNALIMLGYMASLYRNLNYRGICILFDEADPIHSFARFEHQDRAYNNLFQIIQQSQTTPHCYFLYATTPSFFNNYTYYWSGSRISDDDIFELERLDAVELRRLSSKLCKIYSIAKGFKVPNNIEQRLIKLASDASFSDTIGNFVRRCIAILDERR
ncbi:MAG: DUF2791 family P-loop domain-containing protein [Candidatus Marinimicrobia bacterium]|nr:DUF2791 family P-loop domain-containing protein [Candidatus Neomarinimicrobiota bacterium]